MEDGKFTRKVNHFKSAIKKSTRKDNKFIYHYTSPLGCYSILDNRCFRFTDCQFLNDRTEYIHIFEILDTVIEKLKDSLYDPTLIDILKDGSYIERGYDYTEIMRRQDTALTGLKALEWCKMRHFVFCASMKPDALNMWKYYTKGNNYEGYSLWIDRNEIDNYLKEIGDYHVKFLHGPVLYSKDEKEAQITEIVTHIDSKIRQLESCTPCTDFDDYEEQKMQVDSIKGELIWYIQNMRLFFKNEAFADEQEYRIILSVPKGRKQVYENMKAGFDMRRGIITPYFDVEFTNTKLIKGITISPTIETTIAQEGLERFLDESYTGELPIKIMPSDIPVRF